MRLPINSIHSWNLPCLLLVGLLAIVLPVNPLAGCCQEILSQPVEREIANGEEHVYRLKLAADEFVRVEVAQLGADVTTILIEAAGQTVAVSNLLNAKNENVVFIATSAGEFRLTIRANVSGRYSLKLSEQRAATELDRQQVAAWRSFEVAEQLRQQGTADSRRAAAVKFEEALQVFRVIGNQRGEAFALYYLGLNSPGDRRQAANFYRQALPLLRETGERLAESHLLHQTGSLLHSLGESRQALEFLQQGRTLAHELRDRQREAAVLFSLGTVHAVLGERQRSIEFQLQALTLWQAIGNRAEIARTLASVGANYEALGDKQKAIEFTLQSLPGLREDKDHEPEIRALYSLGLSYDSVYERQKAVEFYSQALKQRLAFPNRNRATQHRGLGNIYEGLGDLPKALTEQQLALKEFEAAKDLRGQAGALRNLGLILDKLGRQQEAAAHFKRALPLFRAGADRQTYARLLSNYGKVLAELGEHEQANLHLREALPLLRQLGQRFFELHALYWMARTERARGDLTAARVAIESALGLIEQLRGEFYQPELRTAGFTRAQEFYELAMDLLLRQAEQNPQFQAAAFELSEQARARTLLELLAESRIELRQSLSPELQQREREAQTRLTAAQNRIIQVSLESKPNPQTIAALQTELRQAEQTHEELEREIRRQFPRYAELKYPAPLKSEAARALLDGETALLEYALGQEHSFLFVLTRDAVQTYRLPKADDVESLVRQLRQSLSRPSRLEFGDYTRAARRLYQLLIAPAAGALAGKKRLLIAPDQSLHYLPFECLLAADALASDGFGKLEFLLKRWDVAYVPSASVLASLRQNKSAVNPAAKQFLAFADPAYPMGKADASGGQQRWTLTRLGESAKEATEIARLYRPEQTELYLGEAAKEENVKTNPALATARRIHFATHGVLNESQPQYSGLALTLDDDPREDGLLQVYEIFNLKLQADLIVLSACQTGLGKQMRGEGVIGLTRAFMHAGTPSVVVSLWQVADRSTADLMTRFYRQLDRTGDKADSLRRAKLELMAEPRYGHPYYWAPFVLIGEPK